MKTKVVRVGNGMSKTLIFCERHKAWFYSRRYNEEGVKPRQCPICKQVSWEYPKGKK